MNLTGSDLTWRSRLQFASNENEVTRLVTNADTLVFGYLNAVIEGQPVGVFYGDTYERTASGELATDEEGRPLRAGQRKVIGDPNPDFTLSLSNDFVIRDAITLGVLFDGRFGNDVANFTRRITEFFGVDENVDREITGEVAPRFYAVNPNGRISIFEEYIEDGSFVKLREISLGLRIPSVWANRLGAESARIRLAGRDLYTWTDYSGLDPEVNLFSANTVARGVDFATTPLPRKFVVALDFTF